MRSWAPAVPILLGIAISVAIYDRLPDQVSPQWAEILPLPFDAEESMPRVAAVVLIPAVAIVVWAVLALGARIPGRLMRDGITRFGGTYTAVTTAVVTLVMLLHVLVLSTVTDWPGWTRNALTALLGVGLIAVGNVMPRLRPNLIAGIRTRATLGDERLWLRTHRWFGILLMLHGVLVVVLAAVAPQYGFLVTALSLLSAGAGASVAGRRSVARAS